MFGGSKDIRMTSPSKMDRLVTGGGQGIGLMIAQGFVEAGAKTYIASRKADVIAQVAADLSKSGACIGIPADLSTEPGCKALADEIASREPMLHVLVNNAGNNWGAPLEEYPDAAFSAASPNVKGVSLQSSSCRSSAAGPAIARVINIGSIDGLTVPLLDTYAYSTSKAALHHLTRHMARRLAPEITVNAVAPGPFESKMMAATLERFGEQIAPRTRWADRRPEDMAGVALYLASGRGPTSRP
jgi:NAD(P)-dependent dehydrogenase (short-subunit alcohol dehydrogenase family)